MTVFPRRASHWLNIAALLADHAFETDNAGRFTAFGGPEMLGYAAENLLGQSLADLCAPGAETAADAPGFSSFFATLHSRGEAWRDAVVLRRADGSAAGYQLLLAPRLAALAGQDAILNLADVSGDGAYGLLISLDLPALQVLAPHATSARALLDPQTGLWSAASFADEASRRFDRLDVEGLPGTLLLLGFSRTPPVGRNAVATRLAEELRDIIRPTDVLGRLDATTFGLWCDGMDDLTGAERAARFCQRLPSALPGQPCISVGLAARWPNKADDVGNLILRASIALRHADRIAEAAALSGSKETVACGTWRAWNPAMPD